MTLLFLLPSLFVRYHWRKSYAEMTESEIVAHLSKAREFAFGDDDPLINCVFAGEACCLSWAGTKLETDFLFAGVDDITGHVQVCERVLKCLSLCVSLASRFFPKGRRSCSPYRLALWSWKQALWY